MIVLGISGLHDAVPFKKRMFPNLPERCYAIAQGFDSAAAIVKNGLVEAAAAEERFTGDKGTGSFPIQAIEYCLRRCGIAADDIDYVAHGFSYDSLQSYFNDDEYLQAQFDEVLTSKLQRTYLENNLGGSWDERFVPVPHHLAHASSAYYLSGFRESLILVADGMGEDRSVTIAVGKGNKIEQLAHVPSLHSLGILYGLFTHYLGFRWNQDEYKVMGLAPYGSPSRYARQIMDLIELRDDGTFRVPILFKNSTIEEKESYSGSLAEITRRFGAHREPENPIEKRHKDIASALQLALQTCLMHILRHYSRETGLRKLSMAGGVALNCTANGLIYKSRLFDDIFIQPAAGDDGSSLGAALYVSRNREPRETKKMSLPLWGPSYDEKTIAKSLKTFDGLRFRPMRSYAMLARQVALEIAQGRIVGWFQGRMEFGPRALGSRSILADPRDHGMRNKINRLVKKRESFRPFAPAVTSESASQYFEIDQGDEDLFRHMLLTANTRQEYRECLPAVTHVDGSARIQVVKKREHPKFWTLLKEFEKIAGIPILLNTSFNLRGQPIVCSPDEAIDTFLGANLDVMAIGRYLVYPQSEAAE